MVKTSHLFAYNVVIENYLFTPLDYSLFPFIWIPQYRKRKKAKELMKYNHENLIPYDKSNESPTFLFVGEIYFQIF